MNLQKNVESSIKNSDWDMPIGFGLTARVLLEFLIVAAIVTCLSLAAYCRVNQMLNEALEESVARSTRTIAFELKKQFGLQLDELRQLAKFVEKNYRRSPYPLISLGEVNGKRIGVIGPSGETIMGAVPPEEIVWASQQAYSGKSIIKYIRDVGLVFSVPIKIDGKDCVMYDYYNDFAVRKRFNTISYNGDGTVILLNNYHDWTVLADGLTLINTHPDMKPGWDKLGEKIGAMKGEDVAADFQEDAGSIYYEFHGNGYFIYGAVVSKEHGFFISGYVPWKSVAVGFQSMYIAMLAVYGLIALILIMVARTMLKNSENKQLRLEKSLALKASQTKSDFLSNMSHEIRTPINAILGMDEMILRESDDKTILEYAENLRHAGNTLLGLVNDILDFSKIEAGKMEIINVEYSLGSLLNDLVNMIKSRAEKKGLALNVEVNEKIPGVLYGDEIRIKQIVTNILTNAVKYTEHGSVTLKVDFEERDEKSIWLKVAVQDTGIGIKKEDISKLFVAFERIEEERNRTIEGTGLGMTITQQLLKLMESRLEVSGVYGEGSTFSFKIVQKIVNSEPLGDFTEAFRNSLAQHKAYREKFTAPDAKILVVDDTIMNLTVVKGLLKQTKVKIDTAESGYDCLNLVRENHYDIIFLDHRMPGMDGIETLQKMQNLAGNKCKDTPVISLTANAISGAREQYIAAGFKDYLTKPVNGVALENLMIKYLPPKLVTITKDDAEKLPEENSSTLPAELTGVEGLDTKAGIEHCGSPDAYLDALTVFAESVNSGADEIQNYFDRGDWKNYTTKVHALKSTARVIGAEELSERAKRLEDAGNSGYIEEIFADTPALLKLYRTYAEKLSFLVKKESDDENKPLIEPDALAEAWETLKEVSASFDYDTLNFVLQSLEEYKLPDGEKEKFNELKSAAGKLDWDKIRELVG